VAAGDGGDPGCTSQENQVPATYEAGRSRTAKKARRAPVARFTLAKAAAAVRRAQRVSLACKTDATVLTHSKKSS